MTENTTTRRGLLKTLGSALICAPAIVRISSLMPVKRIDDYWPIVGWTPYVPIEAWHVGYDGWGEMSPAMYALLAERMRAAEIQFQQCLHQHWENLLDQDERDGLAKLLGPDRKSAT